MARLCARLVDTPFVAVVGPSGAGKSSLVRAGLLPALAAGVLPGLAEAGQHLLVPGMPLPALHGPAVVVVDQFEEVFAATDDEARQRFLDDLTALAARPATRIVVVLRGDFVGACAAHARLARLLGDGTVLVESMRPEEIRRAVEEPARQVGLQIEPALVDAVVSDMQDAPGALPLMSTALVEVWRGRSGGTLTEAAYHRAGGVPERWPGWGRRPWPSWTSRRGPRRGGSCCGWQRPVRAACWYAAGCPGVSSATTRRPRRPCTRWSIGGCSPPVRPASRSPTRRC